jgi:hypothetical protein
LGHQFISCLKFLVSNQSVWSVCQNDSEKRGTRSRWLVFNNYTHHVAYVGSKSVTTRNMYNIQVTNLKSKFAIRIRKPEMKIMRTSEFIIFY